MKHTLLIMFLLASVMNLEAQEAPSAIPAEADSLRPKLDPSPALSPTVFDSSDTFPPRLRARSVAEERLALPGMVVYMPFHLVTYATKHTASGIWEQHLLDRIKVWLTTADGRIGIRPLASTEIGSGARVFIKDLLFQGDASLTSSWGQLGRQRHFFTLSWPRNYLLPGTLKFVGQYRKESRESFYGIGHDTQRTDKTSFLQEDLNARLLYQQHLNPAFSLDVALGYFTMDICKGLSPTSPPIHDRYTADQLPGLEDRVRYLESALALRASFVDVPGSPIRGNRTLVRLGYKHAMDAALSHFSFTAHTEQFFELFYRRAISLHLGTDWRYAPGNNQISFCELASLGGNEFLRGYRRGRFRDRGVVYAGAIYKYPVWRRVDGTLFYETGRTLHAPGDFTFRDWRSSYGCGLRVWVPKGLVFEQIVARSSEGFRLLFNFKTAF